MLTPIKILVLIFLHFLGGLPIIPMVHRVVLLLLLQQQQDELDDDGPSRDLPTSERGGGSVTDGFHVPLCATPDYLHDWDTCLRLPMIGHANSGDNTQGGSQVGSKDA